MSNIDPRIVATTPHEIELLDVIARNPDLHIELLENGRSVRLRGPGIWVRRASLADVQLTDLCTPPSGWSR